MDETEFEMRTSYSEDAPPDPEAGDGYGTAEDWTAFEQDVRAAEFDAWEPNTDPNNPPW